MHGNNNAPMRLPLLALLSQRHYYGGVVSVWGYSLLVIRPEKVGDMWPIMLKAGCRGIPVGIKDT